MRRPMVYDPKSNSSKPEREKTIAELVREGKKFTPTDVENTWVKVIKRKVNDGGPKE